MGQPHQSFRRVRQSRERAERVGAQRWAEGPVLGFTRQRAQYQLLRVPVKMSSRALMVGLAFSLAACGGSMRSSGADGGAGASGFRKGALLIRL